MPEATARPRGGVTHQPALRWVLWVTAALAIVGCGLSVFFYRTVRHAELQRAEQAFDERVDFPNGVAQLAALFGAPQVMPDSRGTLPAASNAPRRQLRSGPATERR